MADQTQTAKPRLRNPQTTRQHRQEVFRQITIPLILCGIILLAMVVLVIVGSTADVSQGADIALIWLIVPACFFTFLAMVILGGMVYLFVRLIGELPVLSCRLLEGWKKAGAIISQFTDKLVAPFIKINGTTAAGRAIVRGLQFRRTTHPRP